MEVRREGHIATSSVTSDRESRCDVLRIGDFVQDVPGNDHGLLPVNGFNWETFPRGQPRIILMVDNLDRCPPGQVVNMLEAVQLLVKTKLFVVVLAMDVRYISRALEKEYEGILVQDGHPSGLDFIEKIVQVPYSIPRKLLARFQDKTSP